ncbi:GntR family transcriptional regulator [Pseudooceanicola atlanticus]|uniref:GntR family transcriptional regulator n=1 Tax=Pseudooceanicola atlanticus TaxID=1461694 RepID=UPI000694D802|nr:GntR family transcriptional regulator [Pseudooceanicola atlanticus]
MAEVLYERVSRDLLSRVQRDGFEKGAMLPSEASLCEEYGVSRITIRAAIAQLVEKGLLVRRPGVGTFVTGRSHTAREFNLVGFIEEARLFRSEPVFNVAETAGAEVAHALGLDLGAPVRHLRTLVRRDDDAPLTIADGYSPDTDEGRVEEGDSQRPIATAIAMGIRIKRRVHRAEQVLRPMAAEGEVAQALDLDEGTPIICAARVYFTVKDERIYYQEVRYHPSRYAFNVDLVLRDGSSGIGFVDPPD